MILVLGALVECAYLLIPSQSDTALAIELIITGAFIAGVLLAIVVPGNRTATRIPRSWRVTRFVVVLGATVPVVLAGLAVLGALPGGLNWLAFAVLFALCAATSNAWVLLVERSATSATVQSTDDEFGHRRPGP